MLKLRSNAKRWLPVVVFALPWCTAGGPASVARAEEPSTRSASPVGASRPRFEAYTPSVRTLGTDAARSRAGAFLKPLQWILLEKGQSSSEGVNTDEIASVLAALCQWPDTSLRVAVFAPDADGRPRWFARVDWPADALQSRLAGLLRSEAARTVFQGLKLAPRDGGGACLLLAKETVALVLPAGSSHAVLASHDDLPFDVTTLQEAEDTKDAALPLFRCRLNLASTEADSGATGFSAFRAITAVDYSTRLADDLNWSDAIRIEWPPILGMGAKAIVGRVSQTFFVPNEAFAAIAVNARMLPAMLDSAAGLGPQIVMDAPGEMEMIGEPESAPPIVSGVDSDACITFLRGTGFFPLPDVVIQLRARDAAGLTRKIREAADKVNKDFRSRDRLAPWREAAVRDRPVFWNDAGPQGAVVMPFSFRPVIFTTSERDAKDKQVDFLVVAWTSARPETFARRWLDLPRTKDFRHLPSSKKLEGEVWANTFAIYDLVHPYINLSLSSAGLGSLLPSARDVRESLKDASLSARLGYSSLRLSQTGPAPAGVLLAPAMLGVSLAPDDSGGSDMARERIARQRLKLLYHHSKLFKKDLGRWPAKVEELDGYVDFSGHPELLQLQVSARKAWSDFFEDLSESIKKKEADEEDEEDDAVLDTDLYAIKWARDGWSLGFAADTFEHLERLAIDQDGQIIRAEKVPAPKADSPPSASDNDKAAAEKPSADAKPEQKEKDDAADDDKE